MENKDQLIEKNITIEEVKTKTWDNGSVSFSIKSGKDTYGLNKTKVNGEETKAFSFFKTLGFDAVKKEVGILFKEEPKPFVGKDGKTVNYIRKTIVGMGLPKTENKPIPDNKPLFNEKEQAELAKLSDKIDDLPTKETLSQIPF